MKPASCPHCERELDSRHTEMAQMPTTVVCSGCGSWMRLEEKPSSYVMRGILIAATLAVAWFVPVVLILLPLYLVLRSRSSNRFTVRPVAKRSARLWTINRETGTVECLTDKDLEEAVDRELDSTPDPLTSRFSKMRPFEKKPGQGKGRARDNEIEAFVAGDFGGGRPRELPH